MTKADPNRFPTASSAARHMKFLESTAGAMCSINAHSHHHHVSMSPICSSHPNPHRPICLHRECGVSTVSVNAKSTSLAIIPKRCRQCICSASAQPYSSNSASGKGKVVGMGLACWDYRAQVSSFPQPDEKIRTLQLQVSTYSKLLTFRPLNSQRRLTYALHRHGVGATQATL